VEKIPQAKERPKKDADKSVEKIPQIKSRDEAGKAADFLTAETGAWSKPRPTAPPMTTNSGRKSKTSFTSENTADGLPASPSQTASA
jgi:hypothetical protein